FKSKKPMSQYRGKQDSERRIKYEKKENRVQPSANMDKLPLREDIRGIYLHKNSMKKENIGTYIDLVKDTDLNAVVMDVKDDFGKLTYESNTEVAKEIHSDADAQVEDMEQ